MIEYLLAKPAKRALRFTNLKTVKIKEMHYNTKTESFAGSCRFTTTIDGQKITNLGRITNGALGALQTNPNDKTDADTSSRKIAREVLRYLDSADKNGNPRYKLGRGNIPKSGTTVQAFFKQYPQESVLL